MALRRAIQPDAGCFPPRQGGGHRVVTPRPVGPEVSRHEDLGGSHLLGQGGDDLHRVAVAHDEVAAEVGVERS